MLSVCFVRNFAPSLRIFVRQILNICDNTLRPKYDKSYVLLFDGIKYFYEKLWFALMRHKKPKIHLLCLLGVDTDGNCLCFKSWRLCSILSRFLNLDLGYMVQEKLSSKFQETSFEISERTIFPFQFFGLSNFVYGKLDSSKLSKCT